MKKFNLLMTVLLSMTFSFSVSAEESLRDKTSQWMAAKYQQYKDSDMGKCKARFSKGNANYVATPELTEATQTLFEKHQEHLADAYKHFLVKNYSKGEISRMNGIPKDFGAATVGHMMIELGNKTIRCSNIGFYSHILYMESYSKSEAPEFYQALQKVFPAQ